MRQRLCAPGRSRASPPQSGEARAARYAIRKLRILPIGRRWSRMSEEMRHALDLAMGAEHLPAWFKRTDGTMRYYPMSGEGSNTLVTVPAIDVEADQTLSWVRSEATRVNDSYDIAFEAWARHVASDGGQFRN